MRRDRSSEILIGESIIRGSDWEKNVLTIKLISELFLEDHVQKTNTKL